LRLIIIIIIIIIVYLQGIPVKFVYEGYRVKFKVSGANEGRKSIFPQCKTSIGNNSGSIKHRPIKIKFAGSIGFLDMTD